MVDDPLIWWLPSLALAQVNVEKLRSNGVTTVEWKRKSDHRLHLWKHPDRRFGLTPAKSSGRVITRPSGS